MKLLLDTHVFLWASSGEAHLPRAVRKLLEDGENQLLVSAVSIWEVVIKAAAGRMQEWNPNTDVCELESWVGHLGAEVLPIGGRHAIATWAVREWSHKDPFDRMLVAQAVAEKATLVTADAALQSLPGLRWIWKS